MLNLKRVFKRRVSRDDDLSIVTGLQGPRHIASLRKQAKRVQHQSDQKLLKHFLEARQRAYATTKNDLANSSKAAPTTIPSNLAAANISSSAPTPYTASRYFRKQMPTFTSFPPPQLSTSTISGNRFGGSGYAGTVLATSWSGTRGPGRSQYSHSGASMYTSSMPQPPSRTYGKPSVPPPPSSSARRRLFTTPSPTSQSMGEPGQRMGPEIQYWTDLARSGRARRNLQSYDQLATSGASASDWAVTSGPINRKQAYLIQQEVASSLAATGIKGINGSYKNGPSSTISGLSTPIQQQQRSRAVESILGQGRAPIPSLLRTIQPPSSTPHSSGGAWTPNGTLGVVQGEWVSRDTHKNCPITKQYSIQQLIDILTGDAVPPTSELAGHVFQPLETGETVTLDETVNTSAPDSMFPPETPAKSSRRKNDRQQGKRKRKPSRPLSEINAAWFPENNNDQEQSVYFSNHAPPRTSTIAASSATTTKSNKSVSFALDSQNNVAVETFLFETFGTQDFPPQNIFDLVKENRCSPPDIFPGNQKPSSLEDFFRPMPPPPSSGHRFQDSRSSSPSPGCFFNMPSSQPVNPSTRFSRKKPSSQKSEMDMFMSSIGNDVSNDVVLDTHTTFAY